ncbi:Phospholipase C, partial [Nowakowskiella sp. JEL0078]
MLQSQVNDPQRPTEIPHPITSEANILSVSHLHYTMSTWLMNKWKDVDSMCLDQLNLDQVTELMRRLNIQVSKSEVKSMFKSAGITKKGSITFNMFERFYKQLRIRPEVAELFASLAKSNLQIITINEFRDFM